MAAFTGTALVSLVIGIAIGSAAARPSNSTANTAAAALPASQPSAAPAPATSAPAPAPSPDARGQGSCDVSLSPDLNGSNYLVSEVDVNNTGNVGEVVRVRVAWPQVGFAPIVRHKDVRIPFGGTAHVNLRVNAADYSSDVIGNFQSYQLSHEGSDPCTYHLTVLSTFGSAH